MSDGFTIEGLAELCIEEGLKQKEVKSTLESSYVEPISLPRGPCKVSNTNNKDIRKGKSNKKQPEDNRPPITRFDEWLEKSGPFIQQAALAALDETEYTAAISRWVHNEKRKARAWIIREPKKGDKTHWGRFFGGWLARNADGMTEQDEEKQRQDKQQTRGASEMTPVKDILAKAQKGDK